MDKIKVGNCHSCPFCYYTYDSESMGTDTWYYCNLKNYQNNELRKSGETVNYFDSCVDSESSFDDVEYDECNYCSDYWKRYHDENDVHETIEDWCEEKCSCEENKQKAIAAIPVVEFKSPDWCPLKDGNVEVGF